VPACSAIVGGLVATSTSAQQASALLHKPKPLRARPTQPLTHPLSQPNQPLIPLPPPPRGSMQADIIIAACGKAEMVEGDWVKEGAAVIDVGINAVDGVRQGLRIRCAGCLGVDVVHSSV